MGWEFSVVFSGWGTVSSYNVLVDKETRLSFTLGGRIKVFIEKFNMAVCIYRIFV